MEEMTADRVTEALMVVVNASCFMSEGKDMSRKVEMFLSLITADMPLRLSVMSCDADIS